MRDRKILILGGTAEARGLANLLVAQGFDVTTSLAGVTRSPALPSGKIRQGGFGGATGLADFLRAQRFDFVVDATHPFAAQISANAAFACQETQTRLLRFERPAWIAEAGDRWTGVADFGAALLALPENACVLLTLGRKEVQPFLERPDLHGLARMIEPLDYQVSGRFSIILERPPFSLQSEMSLLANHKIQFLLVKNSGGRRASKLDAARALGVPVIMVARPMKPHVLTLKSENEVVEALLGRGFDNG